MHTKQLKTDNKPLYAARLLNVYIKLIKRKYSYVNINELLSYAKMELHQLEDEGHWFTQEQIDRFYEKLVKLTGNKNIAREAGRYAASPDALGVIRHYILGLVNPAQAYEVVGKYAHNFVRSSKYESKKIGKNAVEITVTPYEGVEEKPYQCENRIGYWEAIALIFNYNLPKIEHPECMFKGGKVCRYIVTWREARSEFWKRIRNYTILSLIPINIVSFLSNVDLTLSIILPSSVIAILLSMLITEISVKKELSAAVNNLRDSSDKLLEAINLNYNNIMLVNEIGNAINKQLEVESILSKTIEIIENRVEYDRGMILLANEDKSKLIFRTGYGYNFDQYNFLKEAVFNIRPDSKGPFIRAFLDKKPILVNDINEIKDELSERSLKVAQILETKSFLCCPIIYEDEPMGVIAVDNKSTRRPFVQSDVNLLMGIASAIAISIHNAMLVESKENQFRSIIQTLAASIDARDFLTAGHSERVTEYAVGICKELGLSRDYTEMVRVAALLHDYGKIGIHDSILKKNGDLTEEEYEEIKTHAIKTYNILNRIKFEGIFKEVPIIAAYHHEKIDGSGYPKGLKGNEIPLGSRIIAVADFFEAITAKRHYRDEMSEDLAFELLMEKSGVHFDPDVVEAFIRYYNKNNKPKKRLKERF